MRALASITLAIGAVSLGALSMALAQTGASPAKLAGITEKDAFPDGCVSCHVKSPTSDARLNLINKKVKKHPSIASVKNVPNDCAKCHKPGTAASLSFVVHKTHYQNPDKSDFVEKYGGACLSCHTLDNKTFKMSVKSGVKNW